VRPGDVLLAKMDKIGEMRVNVGAKDSRSSGPDFQQV
jgi:hypothetical protein